MIGGGRHTECACYDWGRTAHGVCLLLGAKADSLILEGARFFFTLHFTLFTLHFALTANAGTRGRPICRTDRGKRPGRPRPIRLPATTNANNAGLVADDTERAPKGSYGTQMDCVWHCIYIAQLEYVHTVMSRKKQIAVLDSASMAD